MIFIDTFYKDTVTDKFAIDWFDMYRNLNANTITETEGKYKVIVSMDDMEEILKGSKNIGISAVEEKRNISSLFSRIKKHPRLEWRQGSSKIDKIVEEIEKYAQRNKIYLYKSQDMSLEEWVAYIKYLSDKISNENKKIEDCSETEELTESLNDIISEINDIINDSRQLVMDEEIVSIEKAIQCVEDLNRRLREPSGKLMHIGIKKGKVELCISSHELSNYIYITSLECYRAKRNLDEKAHNKTEEER